jgi:hypothetical protein
MLVSYVSMNMANRLLFKGKISDRLYDRIEGDYYFDAGAARNRMIQPDEAQLESIMRSQVRLMPSINRYKAGFKFLNSQERLREN